MSEVGGFPAWQVMLAEVVVGMHDGRLAQGRKPSRNVAAAVAALPPALLAVAREQNATRAARDEKPTAGPRMTTTAAPLASPPRGHVGANARTRQMVGDYVRDRQRRADAASPTQAASAATD